MSAAQPSQKLSSPWQAANLPKIAYGKGSYLYDTAGKQYIDGSGGPAVYCLGHANEEVNNAIKAQLDRIAHGYRYTFTSDPLEQLTDFVIRRCGKDSGLNRMIFVTSGSEAVESCLKIALQYHTARGESSRRRFIARQRSWHGNTLGALGISGFRDRRLPFEGALVEASHLSAVNAYRPPAGVKPENLAEHCANELEEEIARLGADKIAAFIFEPVVGAAGGAVPAPPGYAKRIREICDRTGVLMISDEVMCGAGRTGTWRALEYDGVVPDVMSVAKGLAGGYIPLGAAILHERLWDPIMAKHGSLMTGHTFSGHTVACAAGVAVQTIVERDRLLDKVKQDGAYFMDLLRQSIGGRPYVGDIRGRGFFIGIELVADRPSKESFDPALQLYAKVRDRAFANGLICYPAGGNVDGIKGDQVILAPPYNASRAELDEIADKLQKSLAEVIAALPKKH
jgi:adenosylmethionine-8-amino-7-oxononanoate aminotransferase